MEKLSEQEKIMFYNILSSDKSYPNPKFEDIVKSVLNSYSDIKKLPEPIFDALLYSKNLDDETRILLLSHASPVVPFKLLCCEELTNILSESMIEHCIELYKKQSFVTDYYTTIKPQIFDGLTPNIANKLLYEFEKEICMNSNYAFILEKANDEKFINKIYPLILNPKNFNAIASNINLSEELRLMAFSETCSFEVKNLTPKMKENMFNYYNEGYQNNPSNTFLLSQLFVLISNAQRYLTPELEIKLMDSIFNLECESLNKNIIYKELTRKTSNSSTIKRYHEIPTNKKDITFTECYSNPNISIEDRISIIKDCFDTFKRPVSAVTTTLDKMRAETIILELCAGCTNKEDRQELYKVINEEIGNKDFDLNTISFCKFLLLPDFNTSVLFEKPHINKEYNLVEILTFAKEQLIETEIPFDYQYHFLKTIGFLSELEKSIDGYSSGLFFNNEYAKTLDIQSSKSPSLFNSYNFIVKNPKLTNYNLKRKEYDILMKVLRKAINKQSTSTKKEAMAAFKKFIDKTYKKQYVQGKNFYKYPSSALTKEINDYVEKELKTTNAVEEFLLRAAESKKMYEIVKEIESRNIENFPEITKDKKSFETFMMFLREANTTKDSELYKNYSKSIQQLGYDKKEER